MDHKMSIPLSSTNMHSSPGSRKFASTGMDSSHIPGLCSTTTKIRARPSKKCIIKLSKTLSEMNIPSTPSLLKDAYGASLNPASTKDVTFRVRGSTRERSVNFENAITLGLEAARQTKTTRKIPYAAAAVWALSCYESKLQRHPPSTYFIGRSRYKEVKTDFATSMAELSAAFGPKRSDQPSPTLQSEFGSVSECGSSTSEEMNPSDVSYFPPMAINYTNKNSQGFEGSYDDFMAAQGENDDLQCFQPK
ncbi:unnamed protein product [Caenorhabditis nigoni]